MSSNKISNLGNATADADAVNKSVMDTSLNLRVLKNGDSMTGILNMSSNKISNLGNATADADAVNKSVMDTSLNLRVLKNGDTMNGTLNINKATTNSIIQNIALGTDTSTNKILINSSAETGNYNPIVQNGDKCIIYNDGNVNTGNLVIAPWTNDTNKGIRMNYLGNVGIGKISPERTLDVNGNARITNNLDISGNININDSQSVFIGGVNSVNPYGIRLHYNSQSGSVGVIDFSGTNFQIRQILEGSVKPKIIIDNTKTEVVNKLLVSGDGELTATNLSLTGRFQKAATIYVTTSTYNVSETIDYTFIIIDASNNADISLNLGNPAATPALRNRILNFKVLGSKYIYFTPTSPAKLDGVEYLRVNGDLTAYVLGSNDSNWFMLNKFNGDP
jgi:hypothetical protein